MTNKKRYCISLDKRAEAILEEEADFHGCSYSHVVEVALKHLEYGLIENCPFHISKKLAEK